MSSTEMNVRDATAKIAGMTNINDIKIFIADDERKTVIDAAEKRIAELRGPKQGEVTQITRDAPDFKEGIQKTKNYITCEDVLERMRAKGIKI